MMAGKRSGLENSKPGAMFTAAMLPGTEFADGSQAFLQFLEKISHLQVQGRHGKEVSAFKDYFYHITVARRSREPALKYT